MMSATRRHSHVVHLEQIAAHQERRGDLAHARKALWMHVPGRQIACSWYEIPPGKQSCPHHFHTNTEEAIFVLEGKGAARLGDAKVPIAAGDYIAYPPGPVAAHSITNTGDEPLRYLCMSTVAATDVTVYPDAGQMQVSASLDPKVAADGGPFWIDETVEVRSEGDPTIAQESGESASSGSA